MRVNCNGDGKLFIKGYKKKKKRSKTINIVILIIFHFEIAEKVKSEQRKMKKIVIKII